MKKAFSPKLVTITFGRKATCINDCSCGIHNTPNLNLAPGGKMRDPGNEVVQTFEYMITTLVYRCFEILTQVSEQRYHLAVDLFPMAL